MRNRINILMIIGLLTMGIMGAGCSDWLDVKPKSEIKSDILFETEGGFKDALIGTYLLMGDYNMYGMEMTVGFVEVIGQQYDITKVSNNYYQLANQYDYTSSGKSRIASIWSKTYNTLANINNILGNIDEKRAILHPTNYAMIKGECLGLRAFLHLDMLRLFGYGDWENHPENSQKLTIPYVTEYTKHYALQLTETQVLEYILNDLAQAEVLLNSNDPWGVASKGADYELPNDDKFYDKRSWRFNYYAVCATQARAYLWMRDYKKTLECVSIVIDNAQSRDLVKWNENMENPEASKRDLTGTTEYVFGLHVSKLSDKVEPYLVNFTQSGGNPNFLSQTKNRLDRIYEINAGGGSDYRYRYCCNTDEDPCAFIKYKAVENNEFQNSMPLIKKPELYYIAAECLNRTGNPEDAKQAVAMLNTVRKRRNIAELSENMQQEAITKEILKEYQKEFLCEGQIFYYYKRMGIATIEGKAMSEATYKLPLPDAEIESGGRE